MKLLLFIYLNRNQINDCNTSVQDTPKTSLRSAMKVSSIKYQFKNSIRIKFFLNNLFLTLLSQRKNPFNSELDLEEKNCRLNDGKLDQLEQHDGELFYEGQRVIICSLCKYTGI